MIAANAHALDALTHFSTTARRLLWRHHSFPQNGMLVKESAERIKLPQVMPETRDSPCIITRRTLKQIV